jgi:hypothetical protein
MRGILAMLLIAILSTQSTSAATIYLRDKTRIDDAKIMEEVPEAFHVRKAGENYSLVYSYDTVNKADIFCVIDDKGAISYPMSLSMISISPALEKKELSPQDFQAMLLQQQLEAQKKQNSAFKGLSSALTITALASVSTSIALWCIYGLSK